MNWSARGNVLNQYLRNTSIGTTVRNRFKVATSQIIGYFSKCKNFSKKMYYYFLKHNKSKISVKIHFSHINYGYFAHEETLSGCLSSLATDSDLSYQCLVQWK